MKDIHNHLMFEVDDGSTDIELSIKNLKKMEEEGVTEIMLTPHYIIGTNYNTNNKEKQKKLKQLQEHTKIKLYLGNEVFIDNNIIEYLKKDEISTLNNSRYLLIELPLTSKLDKVEDIIFELRNNNIIPVIAHPERYHYITLDELIKYIDQGCLLQGNISTLSGKYGKRAKQNLQLLLKKHMIHILGTDTHTNVIDLKQCNEELSQLIDSKMIKEITYKNFDKIINNQEINQYDIIKSKNIFKKERIK